MKTIRPLTMAGLIYTCMFVLFSLLAPASAVQWPTVQRVAEDGVPNVELSLAPPLHPWPQVAAELGNLEESRERMENANMDKLQKEFNKVTVDARKQIGDVIGRTLLAFNDAELASTALLRTHLATSSAFLQQLPQETQSASALAVKVNVLPASPPDATLKADIDDLEFLRSDKEKVMVESAIGDSRALLTFVLDELQVQLQAQVGALLGKTKSAKLVGSAALREERAGQLPLQTNVRTVPSDVTFPTVASMVQGMESRRDIAEKLERRRLLEKELDFLMACNSAIAEGLNGAIARIMAQYRSAAVQAGGK